MKMVVCCSHCESCVLTKTDFDTACWKRFAFAAYKLPYRFECLVVDNHGTGRTGKLVKTNVQPQPKRLKSVTQHVCSGLAKIRLRLGYASTVSLEVGLERRVC